MRLLIVGTLKGQLTTATKIAMDRGAAVTHAETIDQALAVLRGRGADLLMIEVALDIEDLVSRLELEHIHVPIVACGIENNARAAVDAIHAGAKEYIPLPPDPELIAAVLAAVADDSRDLIYRDDATAQVIKLATQIATSDASVLITGESGTGKEVLARYVHTRSNRSKKPFICVNCAVIPENLLESELFGHEKGAFTGAIARRIGKFEEATGGTLLLDERAGGLTAVLPDGTVLEVRADFGDLFAVGETGLMGLALDPAFDDDRRMYSCQGDDDGSIQVVAWTVAPDWSSARLPSWYPVLPVAALLQQLGPRGGERHAGARGPRRLAVQHASRLCGA